MALPLLVDKMPGRRHPSTTKKDLGQTLIVLLDYHQDPLTIRSLFHDPGIGSVIVTCSDVPGGRSLSSASSSTLPERLSMTNRSRSA
ncbi:MAG: hypothetical protein L6R42_004769 [Xanthoria sp. 1 TBL-2021]|nr:MAG: hypothetical protein L6R42_004769 [Xanthoria sp. 1 TBL-2021]